jgi:ABC-type amino acid transport substrate-binding protein
MKRFWIMILAIIISSLGVVGCKGNEQTNTPTPPVVEDTSKTGKTENLEYVYKHRDTAAGGNDREAYIWEAMEAALEATVSDYGSYDIQLVQDINQEREDYELINDTGLITVISDSLNQNNLDNLSRLEFPVMRDLLGYRVFLIDEKRKEEFAKIKTVEDLKKYQFGIGIGWNDKLILEHAKLKVYEEAEYKMLFKDVSEGVIDIFSRGINEVVGEYDLYSKQYDNLIIEEHVLLYYPLQRYFWFSKSPNGDKLKARLDEGFSRIVANGKLEEIFNRYFKADLDTLNLKDRILIKLENPIYTDELEKNDKPYNYDPLK